MTIRENLNKLSGNYASLVTGPHVVTGVGGVYVRPMNGHARAIMEGLCCGEDGYSRNVAKIKAIVVAETLCDLDGDMVYKSKEHKEILDLPSSVVEDLFKLGQTVSKIGDDATEELEKNSEETPSQDSESG